MVPPGDGTYGLVLPGDGGYLLVPPGDGTYGGELDIFTCFPKKILRGWRKTGMRMGIRLLL